MGKYIKKLREKTDEELNEIFSSITTYTGEYIDDFLDELDIRRMLWDMKKCLNEKDLITLINKLESISTSKYINLLKHELEIRGSEKTKSQQKYEYPKAESQASKSGQYTVLIGILATSSFFLRKCNENEPKQQFNYETTIPSVNPTFDVSPNTPSHYKFDSNYFHFTLDKVNFNIPELNTPKDKSFKLPKIDPNQMTKNLQILRQAAKGGNSLNPGFQKILDTISGKKD